MLRLTNFISDERSLNSRIPRTIFRAEPKTVLTKRFIGFKIKVLNDLNLIVTNTIYGGGDSYDPWRKLHNTYKVLYDFNV